MTKETGSPLPSRREFLQSTGGAVLAASIPAFINAGLPRRAVKVGLIGCGGRGTGAARDCYEAGKQIGVDVNLTIMADVFDDRLRRCGEALGKEGLSLDETKTLRGFDAYQKVMESDVDLVLLTTPPNFRPTHFAAAVAASKHVFMEKPVAVDPVGCRSVMLFGKVADQKKLSVVAGTQRRHENGYRAVAQAICDGAIGKILGGTIHFCLPGGSYPTNKPAGVADWQWLIWNWNGWSELSGDHIVEQHVHSIDVANWFIGAHPINCVSFGYRARRTGGNMYDFFSSDYEYPGGLHIHSMCRQIAGCWSRIGQNFRGETGVADITGLVAADRVFIGSADRKSRIQLPAVSGHKNSYVAEHAHLLQSIVDQKPINEAQNIAESTLTAIMGRISAYTGQIVTWDEMMESSFECKPSAADFAAGTVTLPPAVAPIPGGTA